MTRCLWVAARKAEGFPTAVACRVAKVSRQGFYAWCRRGRRVNHKRVERLMAHWGIVGVHVRQESTPWQPLRAPKRP